MKACVPGLLRMGQELKRQEAQHHEMCADRDTAGSYTGSIESHERESGTPSYVGIFRREIPSELIDLK